MHQNNAEYGGIVTILADGSKLITALIVRKLEEMMGDEGLCVKSRSDSAVGPVASAPYICGLMRTYVSNAPSVTVVSDA